MKTPDHQTGGDILIVDDALANLDVLSEVLRADGHRVRPVSSGELALQAIEHRPPELVLLDISMPIMSGYDVCAVIKEQERFSDLPIIFITALSDTGDKLRGFDVGAVDFITKPFRLEEVRARVDTQLRLYRLQKRLEQQNSELRQSRDSLRSLQKLQDDLVHMLVHDLRSPLTGVVSSLRLMEEDAMGNEGVVDLSDLQRALQSSSRLAKMIKDLLDIHRMEDGRLPLQLEPVRAEEVIEGALALLGPTRSKRVIVHNEAGSISVNCDRQLTERVVLNLLDNALNFSGSRDPVILAVSELAKESQGLCFSVQDNGPGIPDGYKNAIFEKYDLMKARSVAGLPASGLGLNFCKLAAEAHGGNVSVFDRPSRGSDFRFELPTSQA